MQWNVQSVVGFFGVDVRSPIMLPNDKDLYLAELLCTIVHLLYISRWQQLLTTPVVVVQYMLQRLISLTKYLPTRQLVVVSTAALLPNLHPPAYMLIPRRPYLRHGLDCLPCLNLANEPHGSKPPYRKPRHNWRPSSSHLRMRNEPTPTAPTLRHNVPIIHARHSKSVFVSMLVIYVLVNTNNYRNAQIADGV